MLPYQAHQASTALSVVLFVVALWYYHDVAAFMLRVNSVLSENMLLQALFGTSLVGAISYVFRNLTSKIFQTVDRRWTASVSVRHEQNPALYNALVTAIEESWSGNRFDVVQDMGALHEGETLCEKVVMKPNVSLGSDMPLETFMYRGVLLGLKFTTSVYSKSIEVSCSGVNPKAVLQDLISSVHASTIAIDTDLPPYQYGVDWKTLNWEKRGRVQKKSLEDVILPEHIIKGVMKDLDEFLTTETRAKYAQKGIPYRLGMLIYGPPGVGKTSLVLLIANTLNRPVYIPDLAACTNTTFLKLLSKIPANAIVVLEDVDCAGVVLTRNSGTAAAFEASQATFISSNDMHRPDRQERSSARNSNEKHGDAGKSVSTNDPRNSGLTLTCLLNTLNGVSEGDGRIIILTTNHREALDPALLRRGRCDLQIACEYPGPREKLRMLKRFFPGASPVQETEWLDAVQAPTISPATMQAALQFVSNVPDAVAAMQEFQASETLCVTDVQDQLRLMMWDDVHWAVCDGWSRAEAVRNSPQLAWRYGSALKYSDQSTVYEWESQHCAFLPAPVVVEHIRAAKFSFSTAEEVVRLTYIPERKCCNMSMVMLKNLLVVNEDDEAGILGDAARLGEFNIVDVNAPYTYPSMGVDAIWIRIHGREPTDKDRQSIKHANLRIIEALMEAHLSLDAFPNIGCLGSYNRHQFSSLTRKTLIRLLTRRFPLESPSVIHDAAWKLTNIRGWTPMSRGIITYLCQEKTCCQEVVDACSEPMYTQCALMLFERV